MRFYILITFFSGFQAPVLATDDSQDRKDLPHLSFYMAQENDTKIDHSLYNLVAEEASIRDVEECLRGGLSVPESHDQAENFLTALPSVVTENLAKYLFAEDILSLNLLCRASSNFDNNHIWRVVIKNYKLYSREEIKTKEDFISHYLQVRLNLETNPKKINLFMKKYKRYLNQDNKERSFEKWRNFLVVWPYTPEPLLSLWKAQGYGMAIVRKFLMEDRIFAPFYLFQCASDFHDAWAGSTEELDIVSKIYRLCRFDEKVSEETKSQVFAEISFLNDESLLRVILFCMVLPKNYQEVLPPFGISLQDISNLLRFVGDIEIELAAILEKRVDKFSGAEAACHLIKQAERRNERWSYYLKVLGLKFGLFGFTKDVIKAREYIVKNNVPC